MQSTEDTTPKYTIEDICKALRESNQIVDEQTAEQIDFHNQNGACFTLYFPDYLVEWHCVSSHNEPDSWEDEPVEFLGSIEILINYTKDAKPYGY